MFKNAEILQCFNKSLDQYIIHSCIINIQQYPFFGRRFVLALKGYLLLKLCCLWGDDITHGFWSRMGVFLYLIKWICGFIMLMGLINS